MSVVTQTRAAAPTELTVPGMNCGSCARHVGDALRSVPAVQSADVDVESRTATVRWKAGSEPNISAALAALKQAGYEAAPRGAQAGQKVELNVQGMTCNNCVRHVTEALREVPGVQSADVSLESKSAVVKWKPGAEQKVEALLAAIQEAGYQAKVRESGETETRGRWDFLSGWWFNVVFGSAVTLPMILAEFVFGLAMEPWYKWVAFLAALPVQILCGARFYIGTWNQLKVGQSNMDTLVALGSSTAFFYSTWVLFSGGHGHVYFMDAAAIITLVSVGHFLESKASAQAASSLKSLLHLAPDKARRVGASGQEEEVAVADLQLGDRLILRPGNRVPTDGEVVEGSSSVDESMLTGESLPVEKTSGQKVFAGTLNTSGKLTVRVTATGEETALAHIIDVVRQAQISRANIQRLGDKVSSIFVPIVVVIAIATALWWGLAPETAREVSHWLGKFLWPPHLQVGVVAAAVFHAAAVLIIACPCAMGLATPVAIMAGTNVAAQRGILITDGSALEKSGTITSIIFDKTGTLTEGKVSVADLRKFELDGDALPDLAASLAHASTHPLSQAIAKTSSNLLPLEDWQEVRGSGVRARRSGQELKLGSVKWLRSEGVDLAAGGEFIEHWSAQGATVVGVARERQLAGLIALKDQPKKHAREVLAQLAGQGKKIYLVTGDSQATATAIARQLGIPREQVYAEVRPEGKVEVIRQLQCRGEKVAFVGDGINDAPALESSDLGIAIMNATDVAREAADIILLKADVEAIPEALALAQKTLRTIKQNLFWAFFYNAAGVPLAALGFFTPMMSALAMGLSDLIVIGNALRLRLWKPGK